MKEFTLTMDYYGLLNLHKALLEAKFHENPDNELVSGSPLVASVYIQIRDLLIQSTKSEQWQEWFQLDNRPDYKFRALARMSKDARWPDASDAEKKRIAESYLAPFLYNEAELHEAVSAADHF